MISSPCFPCFTAAVRDFLGVATDKRLNELVRAGRVHPAPPVRSGRRLWSGHHIRQAALALGVLSPEIENELRRAEEAPR